MELTDRAQLALDTVRRKPRREVPGWIIHTMEHRMLDRLAGEEPGAYVREPERVYLAAQRNAGCCLIDQYIPHNPLSMGSQGYEGDTERKATTGAEEIVRDDMPIRSPEDVCEHMERFVFPQTREKIAAFDEDARVREIIEQEAAVQAEIGPDFLKTGYRFIQFPGFRYTAYGYANYFMAYALYPDVIERHFSLAADLCLLNNRAAARAYAEADLPPLYRLDHDMADGRGTLADIATLDRIWLPHFARCLEPMLKTDVRMIWHCDGNLMDMVPRLLDVGLRGFQGFQYEHGMDYEAICRMKTRDGDDLFIIGGVSVTRTLPYGTPHDVRREIDWLVANGPKTGLLLGCSSSMAPGVPWENIRALVDGLTHYREHGRGV